MKGANFHANDSGNDWHIFSQEYGLWRALENTDLVSCFKEPLPHEHYKHTIRYSEHQPFYEMRNDKSGKPNLKYTTVIDAMKKAGVIKLTLYLVVRSNGVVGYVFSLDKKSKSETFENGRVAVKYLTGFHHLKLTKISWNVSIGLTSLSRHRGCCGLFILEAFLVTVVLEIKNDAISLQKSNI